MSRSRTVLVVTAVIVLTGLFCAGAWMAVTGRSGDSSSAATVVERSRARGSEAVAGSGSDRADAASDASTTTTTTAAPTSSTSAASTGSSSAAPSSEPAAAPASPSPSPSPSGPAWTIPIGPLPLGPLPFIPLVIDTIPPSIGIPSVTCAFAIDTISVTVNDAGGMGSVWLTWTAAGVSQSDDFVNVAGNSWTISVVPPLSGWAFASLHEVRIHAKDAAGNVSTRLVGPVC